VDLFNALIKLRPEWDAEMLKVVMTGSTEEGPEWQRHIGNKKQLHELATRFKDPNDPFKIVVVRDMWLTASAHPACTHVFRQANAKPWIHAGHSRDAREKRQRLRHAARLQVEQVDDRHLADPLQLIHPAQEQILDQEDDKKQ